MQKSVHELDEELIAFAIWEQLCLITELLKEISEACKEE